MVSVFFPAPERAQGKCLVYPDEYVQEIILLFISAQHDTISYLKRLLLADLRRHETWTISISLIIVLPIIVP